MSEGSSAEPGREPDPWSQPADFGQPGSAAPQPEPAGSLAGPPDSWSAPPPAAWASPAQPAGPDALGQQPAPPPNAFSPVGADPWTAPPGGYLPPASHNPPLAGQYQQPAGQPAAQYQQPAGQYQQPAGQYQQPAGQYGYPQAPYSPYYPTATAPRNNPVAIAALVCGIGQFVLGLLLVGNILLAIPAIICGAIGLKQVSQRGERGRGMAIAGLVLGILGVVYFLLVVVLIIVGLHVKR